MTLVEVMIAMVVVTISVYMLTSTVMATIGHRASNRERVNAADAARNMLERLRHEEFEDLFALYNADPSDDPGGVGTAPGPHFAVRSLAARADDPDGFVGEVIMACSGPAYMENQAFAELHFPRDVNGDTTVDELDHADDYVLLPVIVRLNWEGRAGKKGLEMFTMFSKLEKLR